MLNCLPSVSYLDSNFFLGVVWVWRVLQLVVVVELATKLLEYELALVVAVAPALEGQAEVAAAVPAHEH